LQKKFPHRITLSALRPTQMTVGLLHVKNKRRRLRELEKRPAELVDFILEHPIRVVHGPRDQAYVIDHHHLALALIKENFETAPMHVEDDFSSLSMKSFWAEMHERKFVHLIDAEGKQRDFRALPKCLRELQDNPYRSLAGFVRENGGFQKVPTPFSEFLWAEYYRERIKEKLIRKDFDKALTEAMRLARSDEARHLPGYSSPSSKTKNK